MTDRTGPQPAAQDDTTRTTPRTPFRTCVGCRGTDSWSALLRVVAEKDETGTTRLVPDPWRRLPGRGAWLHPTGDCLEQALRRRAFGRALRVSAPTDPEAVARHVRELAPRHTPDGPMNQPSIAMGTDHDSEQRVGLTADEHPMRTQQ